MIFTVVIHTQPLTLSLANEWAANSLDVGIRSQIVEEVDKQYGNLPAENKERLVDKGLSDFKKENPVNYAQQLRAMTTQYKDRFRAPDGTPYLSDIDSYLWLRKAQNILDRGHIGTEIRDGRIFDSYLVAPLGDFTAQNLHPYVIVGVYTLLSLANSSITLMYAQALVPILISALFVLFAFLTARKLTNSFGGFFAAMLVAVHPIIVSRTISTDNDSYTVLFHFLAFWLLVCALTASTWKKQLAWSAGLGLMFPVFSLFWEGWWYSFDVTLIVLVGSIIYYALATFIAKNESGASVWRRLSQKPQLRLLALVLLTLIVSSFLFTSIIRSPGYYFDIQQAAVTVPTTLKVATQASLWPNVYTTVAELNEISASNILSNVGEGITLLIALLGLVVLILPRYRIVAFVLAALWYLGISKLFINGTLTDVKLLGVLISIPLIVFVLFSLKEKRELPIPALIFSALLALWLSAMFYAAHSGVRFVAQVVVATSLLSGIFFGTFINAAEMGIGKLFDRETFKLTRFRTSISRVLMAGIVFVCILLLVAPTKGGFDTGKSQVPIFDDGWYSTLTKIKSSSEKTAIITSWWDFGHYFKAVGDRRVTFDGGTQNRPQAHWVGKIMLTSDENEAIAILRMLNCGGNTAYELLQKEITDPLLTFRFLNELLAAGKQKGTAILKKRFSSETATTIGERLYCEPPESYFITSEDMRGKSGVWAHFGSWSFERSKIWIETRGKNSDEIRAFLTTEMNYTPKHADEVISELSGIGGQQEANTWIAPWPSYFGTGPCQFEDVNGTKIELCANQLSNSQRLIFSIDPKTKDAVVENHPSRLHPSSITWTDQDGFHVKNYPTNKIDFPVALIGQTNMLMSPELATSMFTRLFFYNGVGLTHFKPFFEQQSTTTGRILVWKIDWDGS